MGGRPGGHCSINMRARFKKFDDWLAGSVQPTLKQLQDFARYTYAAIGYFFLKQPPELPLPIPDFRTLEGTRLGDPSRSAGHDLSVSATPGMVHQLCPLGG